MMAKLVNFVSCYEKEFSLMKTWIVKKDLMKDHCQIRVSQQLKNIEDITDADYKHAKTVWSDFELKVLCDYHDLYIQSDSLLVANVLQKI